MRAIVRDEQRSDGPKAARPLGVAQGNALDSVASLARATSPCCAPRLASAFPCAITARRCGRFWV